MFCAAFTRMACPAASEGDISSATSNNIVRPRTMAASDTISRATVKNYEGANLGINVAASRPLHKTIDHLFLAGLFEGDGELVAVDLCHLAVAEFLVNHAV